MASLVMAVKSRLPIRICVGSTSQMSPQLSVKEKCLWAARASILTIRWISVVTQMVIEIGPSIVSPGTDLAFKGTRLIVYAGAVPLATRRSLRFGSACPPLYSWASIWGVWDWRYRSITCYTRHSIPVIDAQCLSLFLLRLRILMLSLLVNTSLALLCLRGTLWNGIGLPISLEVSRPVDA